MGMALATTSNSGTALQMPMTLCQLKSRALPAGRGETTHRTHLAPDPRQPQVDP